MFGLFNKKASPYSAAKGQYAAATEIKQLAAQAVNDWSVKQPLLQGAIAAFEEGRPENLQAFLSGYLEFKRARGSVEELEKKGMDDGLTNLVGKPVVLMLEKQPDPARVLQQLTDGLSPYYRQLMLDIALRRCCSTNSWMVLPAVIAAGADVNCHHGRPLYLAYAHDNQNILAVLLQHGADPARSMGQFSENKRYAFADAVQAAQAQSPQTDEAPKLRIAPATPKKGPAV